MLTAACAAAPCPQGWSGSPNACTVESGKLSDVRGRLGMTGAFGFFGFQGTGAPPTGAGGGFQSNAGATLVFVCTDRGTACGSVRVVTDERGSWEVALRPGRHCVSTRVEAPTPPDGGSSDGGAPSGGSLPPVSSDCFTVTEGSLTEVQIEQVDSRNMLTVVDHPSER